MTEQTSIPTDRCPRCGSVRLSVRFASFWAVIDKDGEPDSWQHQESSTEATDEMHCTNCDHEFDRGADPDGCHVLRFAGPDMEPRIIVAVFGYPPSTEALLPVLENFDSTFGPGEAQTLCNDLIREGASDNGYYLGFEPYSPAALDQPFEPAGR